MVEEEPFQGDTPEFLSLFKEKLDRVKKTWFKAGNKLVKRFKPGHKVGKRFKPGNDAGKTFKSGNEVCKQFRFEKGNTVSTRLGVEWSVKHNGSTVRFKSLAKMARHFDINPSTLSIRLKKEREGRRSTIHRPSLLAVSPKARVTSSSPGIRPKRIDFLCSAR